MIAGNNSNRNSSLPDPDPKPLGPWPEESQNERAQRAIGFNCLHYAAGNDEPALMRHHLPDKAFLDSECTDGIRLEIQFPSCWNGQLDGGPTHKSHVAYPDGVSVGNCPEGYDRRLITLFYETIVATDRFAGKRGQFVLANGDPTGFGYHGDFICAWKDSTLEKAVHACSDQLSSGLMSECPVFEMTRNSASCKLESPLPAAIAKENVSGPMMGLVDGLQVAYGPAPALQSGKSEATAETQITYSATSPNTFASTLLPASSNVGDPPSAAPSMGQVQGDIAVPQPTNPTTAALVVPVIENKAAAKQQAPTVTPAPAESGLHSPEQVLTKTYFSQGQEVVEILEQFVAKPVVATTTIIEGQQGMAKDKRREHIRRHVNHRHQASFKI